MESYSFRHGLHHSTSLAIDLLEKGKPGDTIDRSRMAEQIGEPCECGEVGYQHVRSAINHVLNRSGVAWEWDRNLKVWLCLDDPQRVNSHSRTNKAVSRKARKGLRLASTINTKKLSNDERRDHQLNIVSGSLSVAAISSPFRTRLANSGVGDRLLNTDQLANQLAAMLSNGST